MNLLGFNIQISRGKTAGAVPAQQRYFDPQAWLAGKDEAPSGPIFSNAYEQVVWVYRAINVLAEQVANIPFVFSAGERGRENLVTSGPLLDFYNHPHPQLNRFQYWELRIMWLMLRGECFRVPIYEDASGTLSLGPSEETAALDASRLALQRQSGGQRGGGVSRFNASTLQRSTTNRRLRHVLLLDPAQFQHIVEDHRLIGWRYTGLGPNAPLASQVFLPEEVWFEKLPNPFDFWRGFPPLYVAETAAHTDFAAGLFMRGVIENNGDTGVIVRTDKWLSDEQREQITTALRQRKRRAGIADRPVLLLGSAEVLKPQLSSSDLQFLDNRKFSRAEICAAFGVPEEVVTSTDHAKYDVMAGARLNFIENRVAPLCSRLEAAEDVTVKSIDPQASGWFDLDSLPILQDARRKRLAAARTGFEMGVPFNELNRVLDLGFRPLPWGDEGFVAGTMQRVGEEQKSEVRNPRSERSPKSEIRTQSGHQNPFGRAEAWVDALECELNAIEEGPVPALPKSADVEPQLLSGMRRFLFEQRGRVLERLSRERGGDSLVPFECPPEPQPGRKASSPEVSIETETGALRAREISGDEPSPPLIERIFDVHKENEELARRCAVAGQGATPPRVNEEIREALREALLEGLRAGENPAALAARIRAFYNQHTDHVLRAVAGC